jgi:hexosaminidase
MWNFSILKKTTLYLVVTFLWVAVTKAQQAGIIPCPQEVTTQQGAFKLFAATRIYYDLNCKKEARFLQQLLTDDHQLNPVLVEKKKNTVSQSGIYLTVHVADSSKFGNEGYSLKIDPSHIRVSSATTAGVFYAIQSMRQLIQNNTIPSLTITDKPQFTWRAFMLDEGRYFKGEKVVKDLLDEMALLKMNVFHWHLTDDQGWRIEIKKYPRLTEVGSTRRESETGTWLSNKFDGKVHSGFYSQHQIKAIIQYAADRHITIIPEIEMPGHASAAIAAYPWLGTENKRIEVPTRFGIQPNVYNVTNAKVNRFLHDVLDEVMALFPSGIIHIGGDEVKYDQWKAAAAVNAYMKANIIKTPADLQVFFTNGISNYLEQRHHRMTGWNDILGGRHENNDSADAQVNRKLSQNTIIEFWTGDPKIVTEAALKGHDVVNAYWEYTYLDYDYHTTPLSKAYSFTPIPATMPENLHHKVLGLGCQMWGEWIPAVERMNYLVYPRIAAFAEVGWTSPGNRDFNRFTNSLDGYLRKHWQARGITLLPEQLK